MWGFLNNVRESLRHVVAPPPTANHARSAAAATTSTPPTTNVEEKGLEQTLDQLTAGVFRVWHKLDQTATKLFTQALDSAAPLREDATPKLFSLTADACASLPDEDLLELLVDAVSQASHCARQALDEANFLLSLGVEEQIAHTTDYLGCYKWWDHTVNRRLLVCQNLMKDRFTDTATTTPAHVATVRTVYERIEKIRHSSTAPMAAVAARGRLLEDERYDLLKSFPSTYPAKEKVQPRDVGVSAVDSASSALNHHPTAPLTRACDTDSEKSVVPTAPHLDSAHTEKPSSVSLSSTTSPEPNTHSNAAPSLGNCSTPSFLEPPHPLPAFSEQLHLAEEQARLERIAAAEEQARLERIAAAEEQARLERIAEEERLAREAAAEEQARLERIAAAEEQARLERIAAAEEQARLERIAEEERLAREGAAEEQLGAKVLGIVQPLEGVERARISRSAQEAWAIMYGDFVLAAHLIASGAPNTARSHGATAHRAPAVNGDDGWGDDDDFEEVNMDACRLHVNSEHRLSWSGTSPSNSSCLPHGTPHAETTPLAQRNVGMVPKKRTPPSTPLPRAGERAVTETLTANQGCRSGGMSLRKKSPLARAAPAVATPVSGLSSCASPGNRGAVSSPYSAVLNPTAGAVESPRAYQQMVLTTPSSAAKQSRRSVRLEEGDNWDDDW